MRRSPFKIKTLKMQEEKYWFLKPILSFKEGCRYCSLSESRMYAHTSKRNVPHYKPEGKRIYFKREELDEWLLSNKRYTNEELERQANKMSMA